MSGFSLYETLRIFLPGALGVFLLNLALRFGFGSDPLSPDGGVHQAVEALQSPLLGIFTAVFLGLALYLLDLPAKTRLFREGDPTRGIQVPSSVLADQLRGTPLGNFPKNLSLYFLLSDRYLPEELHKRIYLFGSLYRIYVDMRALLVLATIGGISAGIVSIASEPDFDHFPRIDAGAVLVVVVLVLSILLVGSSGIFAYAHAVRAKRGPGEFNKRIWEEQKRIGVCCLVLLSLGFLAILLLISGIGVLMLLGAALAIASVILWSWIEVGPPGGLDKRTDLRSIVLTRLGAVAQTVQYGPIGRLLSDVCLFFPWLIGGSVLYANVGASPVALLSWGAMIIPCTAIMAVRKHEIRLLASYGDQTLWLELHAPDIAAIRRRGTLPDRWS